MNEERRVKHYVSKKTGKVFPTEEWTVGEPVDGKKSIPLDRFPIDIIYHDEKKREPLLSDDEIRGHALSKALYGEERVALEVGMRVGRSFYESLIDEGKLIVAKEVEMLNGQGFSIGTCSGCGILALKRHKHCPGCGGKIKR